MSKKYDFAQRTNWDFQENEMTLLLEDFKKQDQDFIDLTVSNPTKCGFDYASDVYLTPFQDIANLKYEPHSFGCLDTRQAIVDYYAEQGMTVDVNNIILTSSTSEAYFFLFRLLLDSYQNVLFPRPTYPLFQFLSDINDLNIQYYDLVYDNQWSIDFNSLKNNIRNDTKAIVLVNPNNPTGSFVDQTEIDALNKICLEQNICLICDEVFSDYVLDDLTKPTSLVSNQDTLTFILGGLSKALGLPQMKLSWIVLNGPQDHVNEAKQRLEILTDTFLSVNTPVQNAAKSWLNNRDGIVKQIKKRIKDNYTYLQNIDKSEDFYVLNCAGGWYAMIQGKSMKENFFYDLLKQKHVYIHPGYFYDCTDLSCCVLSLLVPVEEFREGIQRIIKFST